MQPELPETVAAIPKTVPKNAGTELARHRVSLEGLPSRPVTGPGVATDAPIVIAQADPKNPNQLGNLSYGAALKRAVSATGDVAKGTVLFKAHSCVACHTVADGQMPKGPHLVDIGKRYSPAELVEPVLKPSAKIAQRFETYLFEMTDGKVYNGFVVGESAKTVLIREATGVQRELKLAQIESRSIQKQSMMPDGLVNNLTPEELAHLIAFLQSLTSAERRERCGQESGLRMQGS